jgi:hypothetical protein
LTRSPDDGNVVVGRSAPHCEDVKALLEIGERLRDRLGADPAADLVHALNITQSETLDLAVERFDARLTATCAGLRAGLREEIVNGDASIRVAVVEGLSQIATR